MPIMLNKYAELYLLFTQLQVCKVIMIIIFQTIIIKEEMDIKYKLFRELLFKGLQCTINSSYAPVDFNPC